MIKGTKDNILDLLKYIKDQKLDFVIAIWNQKGELKEVDDITLYTSFEKNSIKMLSKALDSATVVNEEIKK